MKYLCQMMDTSLDDYDKPVINIIFSEICDSEEEGMRSFIYTLEEFDEIDATVDWLCEKCHDNDICNDDKCCKDPHYDIRFKHTHNKECLCPYDEGTYYYTRYVRLSDEIIKEYIESDGYLSDESLRLFVEKEINDEGKYTDSGSYKWVCTELD